MMNQQPDKFFREKLENYQRPAPAEAWNKIIRLQKKTGPKWAWLKYAASLLLLVGIGLTFWVNNSINSHQKIAHIKENTRPSNIDSYNRKIDSVGAIQPAIVTESNHNKNADRKEIKAKNKAVKKLKRIAPSQTPALAVQPQQEIKTEEAITFEDTSTVTIADSYNVANATNKSTVTLTFTADETEKYLNKSALAEATQEEKKSSTLKKLWQKANDLKSNQDPVGDLREMKNEILALNFKSEKRGQNK